MSSPTKDDLLKVLTQIIDPDLHQDIVSLGFVTQAAVCDGIVKVTINLTTPACPVKDQMKRQAEELLGGLPGVTSVAVEMTAKVQGRVRKADEMAPGVKHVIAVSSGKGGVGKSTVTINLAIALSATGAKVGILDCDVHGPDIPMMLGCKGEPEVVDKRLIPKVNYGIKSMSIGYLIPDEKPVIWRGPMVHKLIEQFLGDVEWGDLDYLLVDMPPGTGDAQLSLAQIVPMTGAVLVTTPQAVSTFDVGKAISMFEQVHVPILGIVENMTGFAIEGRIDGAANTTAHFKIGGRTEDVAVDAEGRFRTIVPIFGSGGAEGLVKKHGFPFLGGVPIDPAVRVGGDGGAPITISDPTSPIAQTFADVAGRVAAEVAKRERMSLPVLQ